MARDEILAAFRSTMPGWRANPDLVRKTYLINMDERQVGGIFLWRSREAAQRWLDDAWCQRARAIYGVDPVVTYYETPFVVDNVLQETIEETGSPAPAAHAGPGAS